MPRFGPNPYAAPAAAPAAPAATSTGRFGSNPYTNLLTPGGQQQTITAAAVYQSALQKKKTGQPLTPAEEKALRDMESDKKALTNVGIALQPFLAISDVVKGIASDVKADVTTGKPGTNTTGGNRGIAAAVGHVTYGLSEYLPGLAGSRARGVTGAELLKGTPYEGNAKAALAVELLSDPSVVFTGAGLAAKAPATLAKLASLESLAKTAEGAALIRGALNSANKAGTTLLRLGDEATGLPAVGRGLTNAGVTGKVTGAASRLADVTLPDSKLKRFFVGDARTVGDTFYTPDVRRAVYTPEQLANQAFRDGRTIAQGDLGHTLSTAVVQDAQYLKTLTKGLKPADAQETIRLLGAFTNATDPAIAAEALRKLTVISTRTGKDLEQPFVAAVKAANRVDQTTLGARLETVGGPAILDPAVTKAIQEAQSGADLVAQAGKYVDDTGRPRGILAAQYTGRGNPDAVIEGIKKTEKATGPTPASVTLDPPVITRTVDDAAKNLDVPASPMMPTATPAKTAALPVNTAEVASEVTARTPEQVMADLFGGSNPTPAKTTTVFDPADVEGGLPAYRGEIAASDVAGQNRNILHTTDLTTAMGADNPLSLEGARAAAQAQREATAQRLAAAQKQADEVNAAQTARNEWLATLDPMDRARMRQGKAPELEAEEAARFGGGGIQDLIDARSRLDLAQKAADALDTHIAGLDGKIADKTQLEDLIKQNNDLLFVSPKRTTAEEYANQGADLPTTIKGFEEADVQRVVKEFRLNPRNIVDIRPLAEHGLIHTPEQAQVIGRALGIPEDGIDQIMANMGIAERASDGKLYGLASESGGQQGAHAYRFFRDANLPITRAALKEKGIDAVRYGELSQESSIDNLIDQDNIVILDRSRVGEVRDGKIVPADPRAALANHAPASSTDATKSPSSVMASLFADPAAVGKTPGEVLRDVSTPAATDPYVQAGDFSKTAQADSKTVGLAAPPTERLVTKTVPTTYRTVQVDSSAIDWAALPDAAARREVANTIGGGFGLRQDARGRYVPNKAAVTLPLDHPVVSRYFDNDAIEGARFGGDSAYGEMVQQTRQQAPNWYNPKDPAPMDVQRATRDAENLAREALTYPNVYNQKLLNLEGMNKLDDWLGGEALAFAQKAGKPPATPLAIDYAANEYAARVAALRGSPPTQAEVFRYRMQLARVQRAQRLRDLTGSEVTTHLQDFFKANPEATLYEATLSAAKQFGVGAQGARYMQRLLRNEESGFLRQMSSLERKEFAQYIKGRDLIRSGQGGGGLGTRLLRNPEAVSLQFKQVFPEEENALKLLTDQAKTRTSYILKAENLRSYHDYLTQSGQHLTESQLLTLRQRPLSSLTAEERSLRDSISNSTDTAGVPAGWKRMDKEAGPFKKGDVVPWWAYHDLFVAGKVDDAAVAGRVLQRGGLEAYSRLWASQNATMLSGLTSIVNDQMGMLQQMVMWGVTPDQILNGMVRRLAAGSNAEGQAMLKTMREQGITSAKLESNLGLEKSALEGLARRLDGDTELSRFQRVIDAAIRWREYGTGVDRGALTNPVAKVSADVAHVGGAYVFQARSAMADLQRESLYFHYLSEGMTPGAAAGAANDVLMDMRLAPAFSKAVSKFWPFFRWVSMSGPRGLLSVFRRPGIHHVYEQIPAYSDILSDSKDDKNDARRILARDGGYINLGIDARPMSGGTVGPRLYLDARNWAVGNTIPQLLDWSGTRVGPVGLPWYADMVAGVGWGQGRNGTSIYSSLLGGRAGGWQEASQADPKQASIIAAKYVYSLFNPSYAPGSARAVALASSIIETAKLPDDGSRDVQIAHTLMATGWGQAAVRYMQQGLVGTIAGAPLTGNRGSPYSNATPSMAQSGLNFIAPIRSIEADQSVQGDAQQQVAIGILEVQNLVSQKKKEIGGMMANPATTPEQIQRATDAANALIERKYGAVDRLDGLTR